MIATLHGQGVSPGVVAQKLKRHRSTVYREIKRNRSEYDGFYRANRAGEKARARNRRSRRNQRYDAEDFEPIERLLREDLSPQQIVGRAKLEGIKVPSIETIYQWIIADRKDGGSLWRHLRCARKQKRKRYGRYDSRGRLSGKKMIGERPPEVAKRQRLGDWEIDTVHGKGTDCVVTAVERKSRLVRIGKLARATSQGTSTRTVSLLGPEKPRIKTITSDNGTEFHGYERIERGLGVEFYFATPHHAWERGTNENTNGLIRQYLPKGTSLKKLTQRDCTYIAEKLNNRPRLRLGYRTPNEVYYAQTTKPRRVASCGKLFGSCPRKRPNASAFSVALQI